MKVDIQFILMVVVIVVVMNMIVIPILKRMMGMVGLEGFSDGGVEWNGNTLVVNGSVEVKGGARVIGETNTDNLQTKEALITMDPTNKNAILL